MITCLYYQDIKFGFYHCGGKLSEYISADKLLYRRIYDLGRNALALSWVFEYPVSELIEDSETYTTLKLNSELNILLEDLNRAFDGASDFVEAGSRF
jgi:hypothetical protein